MQSIASPPRTLMRTGTAATTTLGFGLGPSLADRWPLRALTATPEARRADHIGAARCQRIGSAIVPGRVSALLMDGIFADGSADPRAATC